MKNLIIRVLQRHTDRQLNLASESCRETLAAEIAAVLEDKGIYRKHSEVELKEKEAREHWVCSICGKSTFEVDYDYIGSGTNHLGCELSSKEHSLENKASWSETHSQFVTDDVVEKHNDGHREYPYNSFVKSKEDIQKQIYTEMTSDGLPEGGDTQAVKESNKLAEEIVDSVDKNYIYESPDGGETIYKREFGSDRRRKLSYPERANIKGKIKNEND
jgi:hypothetical protein